MVVKHPGYDLDSQDAPPSGITDQKAVHHQIGVPDPIAGICHQMRGIAVAGTQKTATLKYQYV
jgi:hypothetical protein